MPARRKTARPGQKPKVVYVRPTNLFDVAMCFLTTIEKIVRLFCELAAELIRGAAVVGASFFDSLHRS